MTLYEHNIAGVEITECRVEKPALHTAHDHPWVQRCLRELTEANLPNKPGAAAFGTDAGVLAQHGIPSVVWGPGSIAQAHTEREFVDQDQVEAMTSLFAGLLSR
jgi:acetylornithine deacetylase